jgi:hypothetical protein
MGVMTLLGGSRGVLIRAQLTRIDCLSESDKFLPSVAPSLAVTPDYHLISICSWLYICSFQLVYS